MNLQIFIVIGQAREQLTQEAFPIREKGTAIPTVRGAVQIAAEKPPSVLALRGDRTHDLAHRGCWLSAVDPRRGAGEEQVQAGPIFGPLEVKELHSDTISTHQPQRAMEK